MKKFSILPLLLLGFATTSLQAGQEVYKQVAPPPPPLYGVGIYGALDLGANIYQDRGDTRTFTQNRPDLIGFGDTLTVDPKNDVGFFRGIHLRHVFGTAVRPPTREG